MKTLIQNATFPHINMIGYYPYIVASLFLIYPQSTNQKSTSSNLGEIHDLLREEKTATKWNRVDIACNELTRKEKQDFCADLMKHLIDEENNEALLGRSELVKMESDLLGWKAGDMNTCKKMSIEGLKMEKFMYWCNHREHRRISGNNIYVEGFFISSSQKVIDTAILFRPSSPAIGAPVTPFFAMYEADMLLEKKKKLFD